MNLAFKATAYDYSHSDDPMAAVGSFVMSDVAAVLRPLDGRTPTG